MPLERKSRVALDRSADLYTRSARAFRVGDRKLGIQLSDEAKAMAEGTETGAVGDGDNVDWNESSHERRSNGEFGSGAGIDHPFIATFKREYPSAAKQREHLESVSKEKLNIGLSLASKSSSPESTRIRKLIENELDNRANRGS
jgi:hypothetical protein